MLVPTFERIFLKFRNLYGFIQVEMNKKMSCYLAKLPDDFDFICLSLFCKIVFTVLFSHCIFYL